MATGVQVWSQTAASNATIDTNINWAESMAPSAVNDSARAVMASVAKWRDDNNGTLVTSGTTSAFTLVTNQVESALTAGFTIAAQFHASCDASATIAVDGLAAKPLRVYPGVTLNANDLGGGSVHRFTYSTTGTGEWVRQTPPAFTVLTSTLAANVSMASSGTVMSVTQGTSGRWFAAGVVTFSGGTGSPAFQITLWDGTTRISSVQGTQGASNSCGLTVAGVINNPAGNIRIDGINTSGTNGSALAAHSNLVAIRIS